MSTRRRSAKSKSPSPLRRALSILGPGVVTGASDDDPSGIGTYAQAGAAFGFATLWTALISLPLMSGVQFICAKIGLVTGRGLAGVLRRHYPRPLLFGAVAVLAIANTINAGADIGAIAAAVGMVAPLPKVPVIVAVALGLVAVQIWGSYRVIDRIFKWLTLTLLAYIGAAFYAHPDWGAVLRGTLVPTVRFDTAFLSTLVALFGTTISPYLFFWQASQEVEEEIRMGRTRYQRRKGATRAELQRELWDVNIGMLFSQVVMYFMILATGATLFPAGHRHVESATEAAQALRPIAGNAASLLLAFGLIGAGMLAVPILTGSAAYAVAEALGWRSGLSLSPRRGRGFYAVIAASTLIGIVVNFVGINPITTLFWAAVLNGLIAPPLLVVIMLIANNRHVMGNHVNGRTLNVLGWATVALMSAAAVAMLVIGGG